MLLAKTKRSKWLLEELITIVGDVALFVRFGTFSASTVSTLVSLFQFFHF